MNHLSSMIVLLNVKYSFMN